MAYMECLGWVDHYLGSSVKALLEGTTLKYPFVRPLGPASVIFYPLLQSSSHQPPLGHCVLIFVDGLSQEVVHLHHVAHLTAGPQEPFDRARTQCSEGWMKNAALALWLLQRGHLLQLGTPTGTTGSYMRSSGNVHQGRDVDWLERNWTWPMIQNLLHSRTQEI